MFIWLRKLQKIYKLVYFLCGIVISLYMFIWFSKIRKLVYLG
jgi:hypothetical protein